MNTLNDNAILKTAASMLDLLVLRTMVDAAMTRRTTVTRERMDKIALARDLLVELQQEVRL